MRTLAHALSLLLLAALPACAAPRQSPPCEDPRPLRVALVPVKNTHTQTRQYRPLIAALDAAWRAVATQPADVADVDGTRF